MTKNSWWLRLATNLLLLAAISLFAQNATIVVDGSAPAHPFPHFWEQMFGSGRAILSLRDNYRQGLRSVKQITDLRYIRFHAILHDGGGVYEEDKQRTAR